MWSTIFPGSIENMESNIDSQVNTRLVRQNRSLAQQDRVIIQKLILDEFEQRSLMSSLEVTYDAVREPHVDEEDKSGLQHTTNRIVERARSTLHGLQFSHKPGVDNSKQGELKQTKFQRKHSKQ